MLKLLGAPSIDFSDQETILPSRKGLALLAYLSVTNEWHTREALATLLWPDFERKSAANYLRQALWRLKKVLPENMIQADRKGVCVQDLTVDVIQFRRVYLSHVDGSVQLPDLETALNLYRGDFMAGFSLSDSAEFDQWQTAQTEALRHERSQLFARVINVYRDRDQYEHAIRYAKQWLLSEPLLEKAHRAMMRLLVASGRRQDALAQFAACQTILLNELGIEPEAQTTELHEAIREGALEPASVATELAAVPTNLPAPLLSFFGRKNSLPAIETQLLHPACRLLTIVGPGGVGKTTLSLKIGCRLLQQFPDGVFFVDLAPIDTAERIVIAIAQVVGCLIEGTVPPQVQLLNWFQNKQILLLMDNFEHLLSHAHLVTEILKRAANVKVLATSRERLSLPAEWAYELEGLLHSNEQTTEASTYAEYAATQLFVERAKQARHDFELTATNGTTIATICRMVDGMPLAIELAAAWVRMLTPDEIARELDNNYELLTRSQRDAGLRHHSMRTVFEHSWQLLAENERRVFVRLSIFRGGFDQEAANAVASASLLSLVSLVDKSLIKRPQKGRYRISEVLRQFGVEKLQMNPDEFNLVERQHATFYTGLLVENKPILHSRDPAPALKRLLIEGDNIQRAWHFMLHKPAACYKDALFAWSSFCFFFHRSKEATALFEQMTHAIDKGTLRLLDTSSQKEAKGLVLSLAAEPYSQVRQQAYCIGMLKESIALLQETNSPSLAYAYSILGGRYCTYGAYDEAELIVEALQKMLKHQQDTKRGDVLQTQFYIDTIQAQNNYRQGRYKESMVQLDRNIAYLRQLGDALGELGQQIKRGVLYCCLQEFELGEAVLKEQLAFVEKVKLRAWKGWIMTNLAELAMDQGQYAYALKLNKAWLAEFEHSGRDFLIHITKLGVAHAMIRLNQIDEGLVMLNQMVKEVQANQNLRLLMECLSVQAEAYMLLKDEATAISLATYVLSRTYTEGRVRTQVIDILANLKGAVSAEKFAQASNLENNPVVADLPPIQDKNELLPTN
ncbi:MAG: ATP-binding protein [Candidatus Promineifilaceae bacterium]